MMRVAGAYPQHREEAHERAERKDAAPEVGGEHAADQGGRQGDEGKNRQAPVAEGSMEQEEHGDGGDQGVGLQAARGRGPFGALSQYFRAIPQRHPDLAHNSLDVGGQRSRGRAQKRWP